MNQGPVISYYLQESANNVAVCGSGFGNFFGFQPWYACLEQANGSVSIQKISDVFLILIPVVESLVKVAALVAAGFLFYMIINLIRARGDSAKIAKAVGGMRDAIIGFVIALVSIALINFVSGAFQ